MDHNKLVEIFQETVRDPQVIWLLKTILRTSEQSSGVKGKGIPIGNLTSQFFANVYLNKLDHYAREGLSIKRYIRYMDDIVVFDNDKEKLKSERDQLKQYITTELALKVKERATFIQGRENGLGFLGYRVFPNLTRIKNKNIRRLKKKVALRDNQFKQGIIDEKRLVASVRSILGYVGFADSYHLLKSIFYPGD